MAVFDDLGTRPVGDLVVYLKDWRAHLSLDAVSPNTIEKYTTDVSLFLHWLVDNDLPSDLETVGRREVEAYLGHCKAKDAASTYVVRFSVLRRFYNYLVAEEILERSPLGEPRGRGIPRPGKLELEDVPVLSPEEQTKLLAACKGSSFTAARDEAIVRLFLDTGCRLGELAGLKVGDVDGNVVVVSGKGKNGKPRPRVVPFTARTAAALHRYKRLRERHTSASSSWLWLGKAGHLARSGVGQMIDRRARQAGLGHVHPHQFRHTFVHECLDRGVPEGAVMVLLGWDSRSMLERYAKSLAKSRAFDAYNRYGIGGDR